MTDWAQAPTTEAQDILDFLKMHPDFFDRHPETFADLRLPHPHSGQAISLQERQIILLRDRIRVLETKLGSLLKFAEENDATGEKLHRVSLTMMGARSLPSLIESLALHLREAFAVPHVALRLWHGRIGRHEGPEFGDTSEAARIATARMDGPGCGQNFPEDTASWFGDVAGHLRSFALVPLSVDGESAGLLVLASEDPERFYTGMGTLYLRWLGELLSAALSRFADA